MSNVAKQYKYHYGDDEKNAETDLTLYSWLLDSKEGISTDSNRYFKYIGIQTVPGVIFYLADSTDSPIKIGKSGIFEIDSSQIGEISNIKFNADTIMNLVKNNPIGYIIVDVIEAEVE